MRRWCRVLCRAGTRPFRFELRGELFDWRFGTVGKQQPIRRRGMGMRHAAFETAVAEPEGMHERFARPCQLKQP
jgi:hypothetical protein